MSIPLTGTVDSNETEVVEPTPSLTEIIQTIQESVEQKISERAGPEAETMRENPTAIAGNGRVTSAGERREATASRARVVGE